jgi:hypothetical protein
MREERLNDLLWSSMSREKRDFTLELVLLTVKSKSESESRRSSSSSSRTRCRQRKARSGRRCTRFVILATIMIATLSLRVTRCAAREVTIGPSRSAGGYSGLLGSSQQRVARRGASDSGADYPSVQQRRELHEEENEEAVKRKDTQSVAGKLDLTDQKAAIKNKSSRFVKYATRQLRRGTGEVISNMGFLTSSTTAVLRDKCALQRSNPTIEALKEFLRTTGIDLELSKTLNGRLFHNAVLLQRVQSRILEDKDKRDLVLQRGRYDLPSIEEALR